MASAERKAGSERGRQAIDWELAFGHYAALPPEERSYQAVASKFGVSVRTVERHGRTGGWRARVRGIEVEAAAQADRRIGRARADQLADVAKLIEASLVRYAEQLRSGDIRLVAADLSRLVKLLHEVSGEAGDLADPPPAAEPHSPAPSAREHPPEHKLEVLRALHESGALAALVQDARQEHAATDTSDDERQP